VHKAAVFAYAGIKRHHLDAALHGALEGGGQGIGVVGGNNDGGNLLRDQRVDDFDLAFGGRLGGAGIDDLDVLELLGGLLGTLVGGVE
jgi:hypothetical protein